MLTDERAGEIAEARLGSLRASRGVASACGACGLGELDAWPGLFPLVRIDDLADRLCFECFKYRFQKYVGNEWKLIAFLTPPGTLDFPDGWNEVRPMIAFVTMCVSLASRSYGELRVENGRAWLSWPDWAERDE